MMKRILLVLLICLPMLAMAQKKKMAIYVAPGDEKVKSAEGFVSSELTSAFVRSGKYQVVERANDFLKKISEEQGYQHSGSVDDEQISALGKQFGVEYLCVAKISSFGDLYQISARMLDIETATIQASAEEYFSSSKAEDLLTATRKMVQNLINPNTENQPSSDEELYSFENPNSIERQKGQMVRNTYNERHILGLKEYSYGTTQMDRKAYADFLNKNCPKAFLKYHLCEKMIVSGWVLFSVGIVMTIVGYPMYFVHVDHYHASFSDHYYFDDHEVSESEYNRKMDLLRSSRIVGITMGAVGSAAVVSSLVILPVGYTYRKQAMNIFNNQCAYKRTTACTFNLQSSSNGIGVALRF